MAHKLYTSEANRSRQRDDDYFDERVTLEEEINLTVTVELLYENFSSELKRSWICWYL